ncbi:hypothetical protein D8674_015910 [Pyrus ussuriensis x Pyrus communis]|uniref:Uncharacterized protein n=1 Tax=Pyrus ussuriensis x Pyrus communis TaxID=2448454 RepID=A0A5N5HFK5_9ROSA|nr:hypothetical protein D8674_015910 [Pyrus ussuriensis x Pyrus communis]
MGGVKGRGNMQWKRGGRGRDKGCDGREVKGLGAVISIPTTIPTTVVSSIISTSLNFLAVNTIVVDLKAKDSKAIIAIPTYFR